MLVKFGGMQQVSQKIHPSTRLDNMTSQKAMNATHHCEDLKYCRGRRTHEGAAREETLCERYVAGKFRIRVYN
jgi:hypothetical protein